MQINQISIFLGAREIKQGNSAEGVAKGEAGESYVVDRNFVVIRSLSTLPKLLLPCAPSPPPLDLAGAT